MKPYHRLLLATGAGVLSQARAVPDLASSVATAPSANPAVAESAVDCSRPGSREEAIWCGELPPDSVRELPAIRVALDRMAALGGICRSLAATISELLPRGNLHLFDRGEYPAAAAAAPLGGGPRSYLLLSREMVIAYPDAAHHSANVDSRGTPQPETLQLVLAHEADHLRGLDHIDPDGYLTPNTHRCGDVR